MALTEHPVARVAVSLAVLALAACGPARNPNTPRKAADAVKAGVRARDEVVAAKPVKGAATATTVPGTATARPSDADGRWRPELPEEAKTVLEEGGKIGLEKWDARRRRDALGNSALSDPPGLTR